VSKEKILVFDVETTGLPENFEDRALGGHEILQLAMIDGTGALLFNELFKPEQKTMWPEAQKIHGITPEDVRDCPGISAYKREIQAHIDASELLVAYNFPFDYRFLRAAGLSFAGKRTYDVMQGFSKMRGKGSRGSSRFVSLTRCAEYFGYKLAGAHDAEADARATLHCFFKIQEAYAEGGGDK
jgi:DNA polymerase-3 subunit epsilon